MVDSHLFERVTLDSSVLLGPREPEFLAAADLNYYRGYWSSWIVAEFARVRTEWIILRILSSSEFLDALYHLYPEAGPAVADYLSRRKSGEEGR